MPVSPTLLRWLSPFRSCFHERTWQRVLVLVMGTILARGRRTVTVALRQMGHQDDAHFSSYHQVFNRASWSLYDLSHVLFGLLLQMFCSQQQRIVVALDETLERRWGPKIRLTALYHDAVRSTQHITYCTHGVRWLVAALVVEVPWSKQRWALPFMIHFAPSPRLSKQLEQRHKTVPERAGQLAAVVRRWCADRTIIFVGDGTYSSAVLGLTCRRYQVTLVAPLRLDAAVFAPPPARNPRQEGRPRIVGERLPTGEQLLADDQTVWQTAQLRWYDGTLHPLEWVSGTGLWYQGGRSPLPIRYVITRDPTGKHRPKAYFCTDPECASTEVLALFLHRWPLEVTFEEARAHVGIETQRQWSDQAILRETPCLFGLYSLVTLWGMYVHQEQTVVIQQATWYPKTQATFSDILAMVRSHLWDTPRFFSSLSDADVVTIPHDILSRLLWSACTSP